MEAKRFKHKLHLKLPEHINFMRHNEKWKHTKKRGESLVIWINKQFLISSEINLRKRLLTLRFPVIFPLLFFLSQVNNSVDFPPAWTAPKSFQNAIKFLLPSNSNRKEVGKLSEACFFLLEGENQAQLPCTIQPHPTNHLWKYRHRFRWGGRV